MQAVEELQEAQEGLHFSHTLLLFQVPTGQVSTHFP